LPCPWLGNLHCLVLRSCCLNKLPEAALASLTAVTSLDLSNNYLELLPPGLGSLKQLQVRGKVMVCAMHVETVEAGHLRGLSV
jgi:hypothetical protein